MQRTLGSLLVLSALVPLGAQAQPVLTSEDGYSFDFYADSSGYMSEGSSDAWDGCMTLSVNGVYFNGGGAHEPNDDGRGWTSGEHAIGDLRVRRHGFVPETGPSYARYIDAVTNDGTSTATVTLQYVCDLGSDSETVVVATGDGDSTLGPGDAWAVTDDYDALNDPSLGHVFFQEGAATTTATMSHDGLGELTWSYELAVEPGETAAIMMFEIQQADQASVDVDLQGVLSLDDPALDGAGDEIEDVRNFVLSGPPLLHTGGPYTVEEGSCLALEASADDREGDAVTLAWDLDGDGAYEHEEATAQLCATALDGPSTLSVGIRAVDQGGHAVERHVVVHVTNVAPTVTSEPPTIAVAGARYEHQLAIEDPAGDADAPAFTFANGGLADFPTGMTITPGGLIGWTPTEAQSDRTFRVQLTIDDGDGGTTQRSWGIDVRSNTPPTTPEAVYPTLEDDAIDTLRPTLIARNAVDAEGDALVYTFVISDDPSFANPIVSPAIDEGAAGATEWSLTFDLVPGESYYWKVTASDGIDAGVEGISSFQVALDAEGAADDEDDESEAAPEDDDDAEEGAGCACSTSAEGPGAPALLGGLVFVSILVRRRKRRG